MAGVILAIDPGFERSAYLALVNGGPSFFGMRSNADLLAMIREGIASDATVVIEQIESFGMAVGREVFETVRWAGRFEEAAEHHGVPVVLLPRRRVKLALCGSSKAKDGNVRQALLDRFGGSAAKGTKRSPGPLYGISHDVWSALAIAVTAEEEGLAA